MLVPRHPVLRENLDRPAPADYLPIMKELLRSTDPTVIAFASALLEGEDISVFTFDVHTSILEGSIGILPRRLMVTDRDLFRARKVLADNDIPTGLP
jgi:hypothetical protein